MSFAKLASSVWRSLPVRRRAPRSRAVPLAPVAGVGGALLAGMLGYQVVLRYGRVLVRLRTLEEQLAQLVGRDDGSFGMPAGAAVIEDFEFPELRGGRISLTQWRGRKILLIFVDPTAGPCQRLVPTLAALSALVSDSRPLPVIVSTGSPELNQRALAAQGVECPILLQESWELGAMFEVRVTPLAYLLDEEGRIASPPAIGPAAIMALGAEDAAADSAPAPVLADSTGRLAAVAPTTVIPTQGGLRVGVRAPAVRLPLLTGGTLSLEAYRGRQVLLVFLDPQHGPCLPVATQLEALHRAAPDFAIAVISRGSEQVNRELAAELDLTFPIGVQRHWEVSREYAMFAAPVAYLIDEAGTIAHPVAIGASAIRALTASLLKQAERDDHEPHADELVSRKGSPNGPV